MAAWNPDEAQAAAIYLRLPDNDLLTIRSKDFAGRSAVWVPSKEEGYQKATLLEKKAEKDGQKGIGFVFITLFSISSRSWSRGSNSFIPNMA